MRRRPCGPALEMSMPPDPSRGTGDSREPRNVSGAGVSEAALPRHQQAAARCEQLAPGQPFGQVVMVALVTHVADGQPHRLLGGELPGGPHIQSGFKRQTAQPNLRLKKLKLYY